MEEADGGRGYEKLRKRRTRKIVRKETYNRTNEKKSREKCIGQAHERDKGKRKRTK